MSLSAIYDASLSGWQTGDLDLIGRALTDPETLTVEDTRTFAEKLGLKNALLKAAVNVVADPTVIVAFLLSRKFPTAQYLKGSVPARFVGLSNEFTGLSTAARTVEGFFRGTNVPKLLALKQKREAQVMDVGNRVFDKILSRRNWDHEMPVVSLLLEGQSPPGATPELRALAQDIRGHMDEMWGFLEKTHKVKGGFFDSEHISPASAEPFTGSERPRYLRDYLPHIPLYSNDSVMTLSGKDALRTLSRGRFSQAHELAGEDPGRVWKPTPGDRLGSSFSDFQRYMEKVGAQVFNPRLFRRERAGVALQSAEGQGLFITDLNIILQRYIHGVARTFALNAPLTEHERAIARSFTTDRNGRERILYPTAEPISVQMMNEGLSAAGPVVLRNVAGTDIQELDTRYLNGPTLSALRTLMKNSLGKADASEVLFGNTINAIRTKLVDAGRRGFVPPKDGVQISDSLDILERQRKDRRWSNRITSFFYSSTLGLNFGSAIRNLLQPALTTAPVLGIGPTLEGYRVLKTRLPDYARRALDEFRSLRSQPVVHPAERVPLAFERSFQKTFPELAALGVKADPRSYALLESELLQDADRFRDADSFFKMLLLPFTQAEQANQIVTFYGAKSALKRSVVRGELEIPLRPDGRALSPGDFNDWLNFESGNVVSATQFRPGPGSHTVLQSMLPAPLRIFSSFPVRLGNFFSESLTRGAMSDKQLEASSLFSRVLGGRNWGTVARSYLYGRVLAEGARQAIGVDLADSVGVSGPFSSVLESGRFLSPLTISPLPSTLWGIASYASSGDLRDLKPLTLPGIGDVPVPRTLVPGGVAITKAVRAMRSFRPDLGGFVDDDERLTFRGDTTDMLLAAIGLPLEKQRRTREAVDRSLDNQQAIRRYRREYATAFRNYDMDAVNNLMGRYTEAFPDMPPLSVSDGDLRRYDEASRLTAAQRSVRWLGRGSPMMDEALTTIDADLVGPGAGMSASLLTQ